MSDWKTESSDIVYETPWIKVRRDEVRNHNNTPLTYSYIELHHPTVGIVAMDDKGRILLQRNYRYTIGKSVWELPAGFSDGQDLLTAAKRELMEEASLISEDWTDLGNFFLAPGIGNVQQNFFLARNCRKSEGERDEEEQITEQRFFTLEEFDKMLIGGEINSYMAPLAVYVTKLHIQKEAN